MTDFFHHLLKSIAAHDFHHDLVTIVAFIVLLGLMVLVHEFGHFAVAKLFRVRVEAFSFGFGKRLFGYKHGDTDYRVSLLPLGGYVKMAGENFSELAEAATGTATVAPVNDPGALTAHPRWQQILIGVAGPVANFILAFVLMAFYYGAINEVPAVEVKTTTVEWVIPGSAAAQAGVEAGDIIRRFGTVDNPAWERIAAQLSLNPNQTIPLVVEREGKPLQLALRVPTELKETDPDLAGMLPQFTAGPIGVEQVQPGSPADQAGLRAGDAIQSVDGYAFHTVLSLLPYMQAGQGKAVTLLVARNGTLLTMVAHPAKLDDAGWKLGFVPSPPPYRDAPLPLKTALNKSARFCADVSSLLTQMIQRIVVRKVSASNVLSGPLGIARAAGDAAETRGWAYKFNLAGQISISLGILNLMPIPILDGGMIMFLLIESLIRREININVKERIYQVAFVLLVALFAFLMVNDVSKLPIFTHLKH
ncbi:MAG: RIP metalloprotease RseP [Terracidiphilus sp.]|jgi:regulator of sigma E protease